MEKKCTPLITPKKLRGNKILPNFLDGCSDVIIGFCSFKDEVLKKLNILEKPIVSHLDDKHQFWGEFNGKRFLAFDMAYGGVIISSLLEELKELYGIKRAFGYGYAGSLNPQINIGDIIFASRTLNINGVSKEYYPNDKYFYASESLINKYHEIAKSFDIRYKTATAWTTEAIYREYPEDIERWIDLGSEIVNMEVSSFYAVCKKVKIETGYICSISDSLIDSSWDENFVNARSLNKQLFDISLNCLLA
ncbi:MAG: hypothetical protein KAQ98_13580 [Bacteriovoracaceae bacterium]|nr:hypothetical protein [Bacteriovoracaceae bacterium]